MIQRNTTTTKTQSHFLRSGSASGGRGSCSSSYFRSCVCHFSVCLPPRFAKDNDTLPIYWSFSRSSWSLGPTNSAPAFLATIFLPALAPCQRPSIVRLLHLPIKRERPHDLLSCNVLRREEVNELPGLAATTRTLFRYCRRSSRKTNFIFLAWGRRIASAVHSNISALYKLVLLVFWRRTEVGSVSAVSPYQDYPVVIPHGSDPG